MMLFWSTDVIKGRQDKSVKEESSSVTSHKSQSTGYRDTVDHHDESANASKYNQNKAKIRQTVHVCKHKNFYF